MKERHHQPAATTKAAVLLDLTQQGATSGKNHVVTSQWGFSRLRWREQSQIILLLIASHCTFFMPDFDQICRHSWLMRQIWVIAVCVVCSDVLSGAGHVECGRAEMIWFCHFAMTQPWLSIDCTTWAAAILIWGSCQVHVGWQFMRQRSASTILSA